MMAWFTYAYICHFPDSKFHGANMGPTWVLLAPGGPHVGNLNLVMRVDITAKAVFVHVKPVPNSLFMMDHHVKAVLM